ncbi:MAG: chemotaxis protein methyltransferase CheR [Myxococcales bacterium]|jgi:chemotaxis protein methyltransferase CheR|nr:chemotaxis protein methyltransferase CheR [Myxococcales bacterium]
MTPLSPTIDDVGRFRASIARHLGLHHDEARHAFLAELLQRRADANAVSAAVYLERIGGASGFRDELRALAKELTVCETYFFRHQEQLRAFEEVALPDRLATRAASRTLRLLSAGCASGEEAYSLAIILRERHLGPDWSVSVRAVDVNATALERAVRGRYTTWSLRETPPDVQRRWFVADGREFVMDPSLRALVTFDERNLADAVSDLWPAQTYDVIFCRNVIMYFTPDEAQALVARMAAALAPGGYLFLGHAENLRGLSNDFHLCHTNGTFYYQHKSGLARDHGQVPASAPPGPIEMTPPSPPPPRMAAGDTAWIDVVRDAAERIKALADRPAVSDGAVSDGPHEGPDDSPDDDRRPAITAATPARPSLGIALELLKRERFNEALALLDASAGESSGDADALLLRAVLLTHSGQIAAAESVCARLLALDELSAGAHYVLAQCRDAAGDRKGAQENDQAAAYLDPTFAMPRLHLGLLARRLGDRATAQRELAQAARLLAREDASRLLLFGGGFTRESLMALCRAEWLTVGGKA